MKILLIKPSSLGDVIHAYPAAAALRAMNEVEALDWVINSELAPLIEGSPIVRRALKFPRREPRSLVDFVSELRSEQYDLVVDLQGLLRSALIGRLASRNARAKFAGIGDAREFASLFYQQKVKVIPGHAIVRYLQVVRALGACVDGEWRFPLPPTVLPEGFSTSPEYVVIHPFSRGAGKALGASLVSALVEAVAPRRAVIVGQGEMVLPAGVENLTGRTTLPELMGVLQCASGVISSDSGPMHLAVALGRPTVALFGVSSNPELTGPWAENSCAVRIRPQQSLAAGRRATRQAATALDHIPAELVVRELHRMMGKTCKTDVSPLRLTPPRDAS